MPQLSQTPKGISQLAGLVVVLVIAILGVGGWYMYDRGQSEGKGVDLNRNTNMVTSNSNTSATSDGHETFIHEDLKVSFEYPASWGLSKESIEQDEEEGSQILIEFVETSKTSFGSSFQLLSNTVDFAPGREGWFAEKFSHFVKENGFENICSLDSAELVNLTSNQRNCSIHSIGNRKVAEFSAQINSLDGMTVLQFVRVFVFETGNQQYPIGSLVMFLPEINKQHFIEAEHYPDGGYWEGYATNDVDAIDQLYLDIESKNTHDQHTNEFLRSFEKIIDSFTYL